jgi:putative addiction module component (TIGR02574 family)
MQSQFDILTAQALQLTPDEREALMQLLAASLDTDATEDDALATEVERRIAALESGATQAIPLAGALASVRAGLK